MNNDDRVQRKRLRVAILGSGNIGTDLLIKTIRSAFLDCRLFIGRRSDSLGIAKARALGIKVSELGMKAITDNPSACDLIFDATSAMEHKKNWPLLEKLGKIVIDMTPSQIGKMIIPAINLKEAKSYQNTNMVSCGGQAAIPLVCILKDINPGIEYIEVVSSIASRSAGPATRQNIDEYVENTEKGLRAFSGCPRVKAILILNPARPCINMQTTISVKVSDPDMEKTRKMVFLAERKIQEYVPGYEIVVPPVFESNRIVVTVRVRGLGDYLPDYAGNLDIMNCAAVATAEQYAQGQERVFATLEPREKRCVKKY